MKKLFFLLTLLIPLSCYSQFSGSGAGTEGDPYQITDVNQLQEMQNHLSSHFVLMNDIDAGVTSTWNGGDGFVPVDLFTGSLNGLDFTISDLFMRTGSSAGLFDDTTNAEISNIVMTGANVELTGNRPAGILVNELSGGSITNCHIEGTITGGGLLGNGLIASFIEDGATIIGCSAHGVIAGVNYRSGGICGYARESTIRECLSTVSVVTNTGFPFGTVLSGTGSLCGSAIDSIIINCYATGDISLNAAATGNADPFGGLVGTSKDTILTNCYSTGTVSGSATMGGLIGLDAGGNTFTNCFYDSETSGFSDTGKGTPKTTAEMQTLSTFVGWDFTSVWRLNPAEYPRLQLEFEPEDVETVPTLSEWGIITLILGLSGAFFVRVRRMNLTNNVHETHDV